MNPIREEEGPCIVSFGSVGEEDPFIGKGSLTEEIDQVIGIRSYKEENLFISFVGSVGEDDFFLGN